MRATERELTLVLHPCYPSIQTPLYDLMGVTQEPGFRSIGYVLNRARALIVPKKNSDKQPL